MNDPVIDPTISLGNILTIVTTLGSVTLAAWKIVTRLSKMEMKLNLMWSWFKREHKIESDD